MNLYCFVLALFLIVVLLGGPETLRQGEQFNFQSAEELLWQIGNGKHYFGGRGWFGLLCYGFLFMVRLQRKRCLINKAIQTHKKRAPSCLS